jgi:hypothetical protein
MSWEIAENRRVYLERFPEERHVKNGSFSVANLHRPLNTPIKKTLRKPAKRTTKRGARK